MEEKNLFLLVMEAGGSLVEPFDAGGGDMGMDTSTPPADSPPDASGDMGGDPPPLPTDTGGMDNLGFDMSNSGGDEMGIGADMSTGDDGQQEESTKNGGEKLSEKANSILNQKLYQQMMDRNQEIEDTIESITRLTPLLPYQTIRENDENMTRLKAALDKGKSYLLENFVNAKYGENLIFFQKLDALYTLLIEQLNTNLKKLKDSND